MLRTNVYSFIDVRPYRPGAFCSAYTKKKNLFSLWSTVFFLVYSLTLQGCMLSVWTLRSFWKASLTSHIYTKIVSLHASGSVSSILELSRMVSWLWAGTHSQCATRGQETNSTLRCIGQQVKGGNPPHLLDPGEATSRVLCPVMSSSVQERQWATGDGPAEATRLMRGLEHLPYEERQGAGAGPV